MLVIERFSFKASAIFSAPWWKWCEWKKKRRKSQCISRNWVWICDVKLKWSLIFGYRLNCPSTNITVDNINPSSVFAENEHVWSSPNLTLNSSFSSALCFILKQYAFTLSSTPRKTHTKEKKLGCIEEVGTMN